MDLYLFNLINGLAGKRKWLDFIGIFLAKYFPFILFLAVIIFCLKEAGFEFLCVVIFSGIVSRFFINEIIYVFYQKQRPTGVKLIKLPKNPAFPSGHASFYFGLVFPIFFYNPFIGSFFFLSAFLISLFRVYCGAHWPSDILAGMVAGFLPSIILKLIYGYF